MGIILIVQIFSGFLLTFFYIPSAEAAFQRSDFLSREIFGGFLLRIIHLNGASFFFFCIYFHISRGIFYICFVQTKTWFSGVLIYLMSIGIAFLGYVLPWGQISFWGASVITNLIATAPVIGTKIVLWVWGGYNVNSATLTIFFTIHYLLPFVLIILIFFHLFFLHEAGRITPLKRHSRAGKISFCEYFFIKDSINIPVILLIYSLCFFSPWSLGDPENWIPADPIKSPVHIQPEWYFLFAYAILRRVPNKLGGVICLLLRVLIFFLLVGYKKWEQKNSVVMKFFLIFFFITFLSLTWLGGCGVEAPFILFSQVYSFFYFFTFLCFNFC